MPRSPIRQGRRPRSVTRPQLELMEARQLLATIVVTGTGDSIANDGIVTLREAITAANTNAASGDATAGDAGLDTIAFDIPGDGLQTITVQSQLPTITDPVKIDGYTQHGASANTLATGNDAVLRIEVDGPGSGGDITGFTFDAADSTIRGLVLDRFTIGIIADSDRNVIAGNFIGVNAQGVEGQDNVLYYGIKVISGAGNVVGGTSAAARNVVSGSIYQNISVSGINTADGTPVPSAPSATLIQGNYIGTTAAGTDSVDVAGQSQGVGIFLVSNDGTVIGGPGALARNVISGNTNGIFSLSFTTNLTIQGNFIGVDATGSVALENSGDGIDLTNANVPDDTVLIGGTTAGAGNVISGNGYKGVYVNAYHLVFQGNLVGTSASGTAVIGNAATGVEITGGDSRFGPNNDLIGGTSAAARNVIAGSTGSGILFEASGDGTRLVQGNFIGTLADGTTPAGNLGFGIVSTTRVAIGGAAAGAGNVIANNSGGGVSVGDSDVPYPTGISILGNSIYNNALVEIALLQLFTYPNDPGDTDVGANNYQNYPLVNSAVLTAGGATISGSLNSQPLTAYTIEFFSNVSLDPTAANGRQTFLGRTMATTGATGDVSFTANVDAPPAGESIITATATDPDGNTSPFTVDPAVLSTPAASADLAVTVSGAPDPVNAGDNLTYTITVTNDGPDAASSLSLVDDVPAGTTFVSFTAPAGWAPSTPGAGGTGSVSATADALPSGDHATFTLVVRVGPGAAEGATIVDSASISSSPSTDTDSDNDTDGATTTVAAATTEPPPMADLEVTQSTPAGTATVGQGAVTFTITVTNHGPAPASNAKLIETLPVLASFDSATGGATPSDGKLTFPLGDLASGAKLTFTVIVRPSLAGILTASATASATETDPTVANNTATASASAVDPVTIPPPPATFIDGPHIVKVKRFGIHTMPTTLVLTFDSPLGPSAARNVKNYQITDPKGASIAIRSAVYDAAAHTVTLRPSQRISIHHPYKLLIRGTGPDGLSDGAGHQLDSKGIGQPGSNYATRLTWRNLILPRWFHAAKTTASRDH
jgi:uncharacterized repeat protein (TIGR01451 family)